jgi:hypothetical protein
MRTYRLRCTVSHWCLLVDLGLDQRLGLQPASKSSLDLTTDQMGDILRYVPRHGRTGMSLRRNVAHLLNTAKEATE